MSEMSDSHSSPADSEPDRDTETAGGVERDTDAETDTDSCREDSRPAAAEAAAIAGPPETAADVAVDDSAGEGAGVDAGHRPPTHETPTHETPASESDTRSEGPEPESESEPESGSKSESESDQGTVTCETWERLFPYDEPYTDQRDAIPKVIDSITDDGFTMLEAACGTGKTLIALAAGLAAVRDDETPYEQIVVATSVKQQLRAFEDDLERINDSLPDEIESVSALSLVGKADLCSFTDSGFIDPAEIYSQCDSLREPVRTAATADNPGVELTELAADPTASDATATQLTSKSKSSDAGGSDGDTSDGRETDWTAPYADEIPTTNNGGEYCPFYAEYRRQALAGEPDFHPDGVVRPWDLLEGGSEKGMCPHALLLDSLSSAEVLVSNYMHIFDPLTIEVLGEELFGEETILIADEAHNIPNSVRDLLSDTLSHTTIVDAIDEIDELLLDDAGTFARYVEHHLKQQRLDRDRLRDFQDLLGDLWEYLNDIVVQQLDAVDTQWHEHPTDLPAEIEQSLRDPETVEPDALSVWIRENDYEALIEDAGRIQTAIAAAIDEYDSADDSTDLKTDTVARLLHRWWTADHETYFRQLVIDQLDYERVRDRDWESNFTARLKLRNCLPKAEIADILDNFGAGVLMSATLEPLDVFRECVGLDQLETDGRPITELTYGLSYPAENRFSAAVSLPKYTYKNRQRDGIQQQYSAAIRSVVRETDGNVLICMPSYSLGRWAAEEVVTDGTINKPVRADGPEQDSEALKEWFFADESKVLTTGMLGTLTEGVDYDGDRLAAAVVCGVPIRNLSGDYPDAIKLAYEQAFGSGNGFEYAFTVPAVRKTRQALGRVIRGPDERGVRVLLDKRYASQRDWDDVRGLLPGYTQTDYQPLQPDALSDSLRSFWKSE